MAEAIIDGIGSGYKVQVDDSNRLMVRTEGIGVGSVTVGSIIVEGGSEMWIQNTVEVSGIVSVDNVGSNSWIKGGSLLNIEVPPISANMNNPAWKLEYDGANNVGSITEFISNGSYVSVLEWTAYSGTGIGTGSNITNIGSYF